MLLQTLKPQRVCFLELLRQNKFATTKLDDPNVVVARIQTTYSIQTTLVGLTHQDLKAASEKLVQQAQPVIQSTPTSNKGVSDFPFAHLHTLSQFSVLQSTIRVKELAETADKLDMPAVALTDLGNLMGAFHFVKSVKQVNAQRAADDTRSPLKPIVGITLNVCENHQDRSRRDDGYQVVFLAKKQSGISKPIQTLFTGIHERLFIMCLVLIEI